MSGATHAPQVAVESDALVRANPTGVDRYARGLVDALMQARPEWEWTLTTFSDQVATPFAPGRARLRTTPLPKAAYRAAQLTRTAPPYDLVMRTRADLWIFPDFVRPPLRAHSPSVTVVHDTTYLLPERSTSRLHRRFLRREVPSALRRSSLVVVNSEFTRDELQARYGVARSALQVASPGLDQDRFHPPAAADIERVRSVHGLPGPYLLHVGQASERKNLVRLIDAYDRLPSRPTGRPALVLAGGAPPAGSPLQAAVRRPRREGSVRLLGRVQERDLPGLYGGATLVVVPSLHEGFGYPLLEAMACGAPVLAHAGGALPEVGGDAAAYVDARDLAALTAALDDLLGDQARRARMVEAGRVRAGGVTWAPSAQLLASRLEALL